MENYSAIADFLNKFHTAPEWIQAFWIGGATSAFLMLLWVLREIAVALCKRRQVEPPPGTLCYSIYRARQGTLQVYRHDHDGRLELVDSLLLAVPKK